MNEFILVFLAMTVLDFVFSLYTRRVADGSEYRAGIWAVAIILLNGYVMVQFVDSLWHLIPAGLGAFVGTVIAVKLDKRS